MGHTRLGVIPTSRKWKAVVASIAESGTDSAPSFVLDVAEIAHRTLDAAEVGLERAIGDEGLRYTFFLLTQIALAAREKDWHGPLSEAGISIEAGDSVFQLTTKMQIAIDDHVTAESRATDVSEMAQQAAGEAIAELVRHKATTLFGSGEKELQAAIHSISTKKGFADLGQKFFGRFMSHFLNFYLSRATAANVGNGPIRDILGVSNFNRDLERHCEETAQIVRQFCGEWYSKTQFVEGISIENTSRFMAVALSKLQAELQRQREKL